MPERPLNRHPWSVRPLPCPQHATGMASWAVAGSTVTQGVRFPQDCGPRCEEALTAELAHGLSDGRLERKVIDEHQPDV
jgi:hypothetical protein